MTMSTLVIGVAGGTGSGKTTVDLDLVISRIEQVLYGSQ